MIDSFTGQYRFLSNFWDCEVEFEGWKYPSVENAYQAAKSLDPEVRQLFEEGTASNAKKMGKNLKELRPDWEEVKLSIMENLVRQKFSREDLRIKLLETWPQELVEGNYWHDNFFGICSCKRKAECDGSGKNHLGKLLMKIRSEYFDAVVPPNILKEL